MPLKGGGLTSTTRHRRGTAGWIPGPGLPFIFSFPFLLFGVLLLLAAEQKTGGPTMAAGHSMALKEHWAGAGLGYVTGLVCGRINIIDDTHTDYHKHPYQIYTKQNLIARCLLTSLIIFHPSLPA